MSHSHLAAVPPRCWQRSCSGHGGLGRGFLDDGVPSGCAPRRQPARSRCPCAGHQPAPPPHWPRPRRLLHPRRRTLRYRPRVGALLRPTIRRGGGGADSAAPSGRPLLPHLQRQLRQRRRKRLNLRKRLPHRHRLRRARRPGPIRGSNLRHPPRLHDCPASPELHTCRRSPDQSMTWQELCRRQPGMRARGGRAVGPGRRREGPRGAPRPAAMANSGCTRGRRRRRRAPRGPRLVRNSTCWSFHSGHALLRSGGGIVASGLPG